MPPSDTARGTVSPSGVPLTSCVVIQAEPVTVTEPLRAPPSSDRSSVSSPFPGIGAVRSHPPDQVPLIPSAGAEVVPPLESSAVDETVDAGESVVEVPAASSVVSSLHPRRGTASESTRAVRARYRGRWFMSRGCAHRASTESVSHYVHRGRLLTTGTHRRRRDLGRSISAPPTRSLRGRRHRAGDLRRTVMGFDKRSAFHQEVVEALLESKAIDLEAAG